MIKKNNVFNKMYIIILALLIVFLVAVLAKHYIKKKECKNCAEYLTEAEVKDKKRDKKVKWQGYTEKEEEKKKGDLMGKLIGCFLSNQSLFPLPEKMELCDDCYQTRKGRMLQDISPELLTRAQKEHKQHLKKKLLEIAGDAKKEKEFKAKGDPDVRYDPKYAWYHKPEGVRYKFREFD